MTITFDDARAIVAASTSVRQMWGDDFRVADYGWENDDVSRPALLVDKRTGKLTEVYGLEWRDPVAGLVPIGNPPD